VLVPGAPLIVILFSTQVVNAVLLLPLLVAMRSLARDRDLLGPFANRRVPDASAVAALAIVLASIVALAVAAFA
jgi:Mn2+/Fe2+ NRAMP family transporter